MATEKRRSHCRKCVKGALEMLVWEKLPRVDKPLQRFEKGDGQFTLWGTTCFGTCDFLLSLELNSGRMNWTSNTGWFMAEAWFLQMSWEIWGVWNIAGDGYIAQGWLLSLESVSQCCIYSVLFSALVQLPPPPKERSVTSGWKAAHLGNST